MVRTKAAPGLGPVQFFGSVSQNFVPAESSEEAPHVPNISGRKSARVEKGGLEILGQNLHDSFALSQAPPRIQSGIRQRC
jgi:hypothetical protein